MNRLVCASDEDLDRMEAAQQERVDAAVRALEACGEEGEEGEEGEKEKLQEALAAAREKLRKHTQHKKDVLEQRK
jgi:hypothetical protein